MKRENIHQPFEIVYKELEECPQPEHSHSFFELVYIVYGTGVQLINNNSFNYSEGHMFLITPEDSHSFEVSSKTGFFFIRFNDIYIKSGLIDSVQTKRLELILENANHQPGCILRNKSDKLFTRPLVEAIIRERSNHNLFDNELVVQLVNSIIIIVARNIAKCLPAKINSGSEKRIVSIIQYVQNNIYNPEKIKAGDIAQHFGLSEFYMGRYFKKHTGETLQQYILNYKLRLIEIRLKYSDLRIGEIAFELGFSDESHMVKFFKKAKGISPGEFRKVAKRI